MPNIVDRFNINGEDYHIEPVMDDVPTEGSNNTVKSGGVYDALHSTNPRYDKAFLGAMFGRMLGQEWTFTGAPAKGARYTLATDDGLVVSASNPITSAGVEWSVDGVNWTQCTGLDAYNSNWGAIVVHDENGGWMLRVGNTTDAVTHFYTSENGKVWHKVAEHAKDFIYAAIWMQNSCAYAYGKWWLSTFGSGLCTLYSSSNLSTWTEVVSFSTSGSLGNITIAKGDDALVFMCGDNYSYTTNGSSWTTVSNRIMGVTYYDGYWYFGANNLNNDGALLHRMKRFLDYSSDYSHVNVLSTGSASAMYVQAFGSAVVVGVTATGNNTTSCAYFSTSFTSESFTLVAGTTLQANMAGYANGVAVGTIEQHYKIDVLDGMIVSKVYPDYPSEGSGTYTGLATKPVYLKNAGCWTTRVAYSNVDMLINNKLVEL